MTFIVHAVSENRKIVRVCETPEAALEQGSTFLVLIGGDVNIINQDDGSSLTLQEFRVRLLDYDEI